MNNEQNNIHAVATTDGQLVVLADNYGFHIVVPSKMVIDALHGYLIAKSDYFLHYGRNYNIRVLIPIDPTNFAYPTNLSTLAQHFAPELWAKFVDKTENKPGILEQL